MLLPLQSEPLVCTKHSFERDTGDRYSKAVPTHMGLIELFRDSYVYSCYEYKALDHELMDWKLAKCQGACDALQFRDWKIPLMSGDGAELGENSPVLGDIFKSWHTIYINPTSKPRSRAGAN